MKVDTFKKYVPIFFYFLLLVYIFQFRWKLDRYGDYFTSDGAIKIYQTVQYKEKGFFSLECYYPNKTLDPDFTYFPISYPWALFNNKGEKCIFEYPPFFYWIGAVLLHFIPISLLLYLPLVFYSLGIFLFDYILKKAGFDSLFRVFVVILTFFSFPLLTAMDYTENPLFQLLYLCGFYGFFHISEKPPNLKIQLLIGFFFGLSFILRLEIIIPFFLILFFYFVLYRNIKLSFFVGVGFFFSVLPYLVYNFFVSGHILGFRYISSVNLNANAHASLGSRLNLLKAYVWGDEIMVGLLQFNPLCYVIVLGIIISFFFNSSIKKANLFLFSGFLSILIIPFLLPIYGGVGYFGLRYLEAPFFLIVVGYSIYFSNLKFIKIRYFRLFFFVILSFVFYFNLLSTREGLKVLRSSSLELHGLHLFLNRSDKFVIHTSLYSSIWMGKNYLEKIHIKTSEQSSFEQFLQNIKSNEKFVVIKSTGNIYISSDIPKTLYPQYITNVKFSNHSLKILEEQEVFGIKLSLIKKL